MNISRTIDIVNYTQVLSQKWRVWHPKWTKSIQTSDEGSKGLYIASHLTLLRLSKLSFIRA